MLRNIRGNSSTMTSILGRSLENGLGRQAVPDNVDCLVLLRLQFHPVSHKPIKPTGITPLKILWDFCDVCLNLPKILTAHPALAPAAMPAVGRMAPAPPVARMVGPGVSGAGERIGRTHIHHPRRGNHGNRRSHPDRYRGHDAPGQQQHTRYDGDRFHLTTS